MDPTQWPPNHTRYLNTHLALTELLTIVLFQPCLGVVQLGLLFHVSNSFMKFWEALYVICFASLCVVILKRNSVISFDPDLLYSLNGTKAFLCHQQLPISNLTQAAKPQIKCNICLKSAGLHEFTFPSGLFLYFFLRVSINREMPQLPWSIGARRTHKLQFHI